MSYSCSDFTDTILDALNVEVPEEDYDDPSAQADLCLIEIDSLMKARHALRALFQAVDRCELASSVEIAQAMDQTREALA